MKKYHDMTKEELKIQEKALQEEYEKMKGLGLKLDMSRGKPSVEQLDTVMPMMDILNSNSDMRCETGLDTRNYGFMEGIPEARRLMAEMMDVSEEEIIACGNASLSLMFDCVSRSMTHGVCGSTPWSKLDKVKFLCPAPGYDRHFKITEYFGIEMITVPMFEDGPDMEMIERLVSKDASIKGLWSVPKYSNPQGYSYSDDVVKRFAALKPAAEDFRLYWDNAYCVHHLYPDDHDEILEILDECRKAGNPDLAFKFCSTSKVSFSGGGISAIAASPNNLAWVKKSMMIQTIGYDKVNMLRHARYYKNKEGIMKQMWLHADLMRPKFKAILEGLDRELSGLGIGEWTNPKGGYFISFDSLPGCAKQIVAMCKEAGVILTEAGATYPYGIDPQDRNIRLAPSFPTPEELAQATALFVLCVKLASTRKLLEE